VAIVWLQYDVNLPQLPTAKPFKLITKHPAEAMAKRGAIEHTAVALFAAAQTGKLPTSSFHLENARQQWSPG